MNISIVQSVDCDGTITVDETTDFIYPSGWLKNLVQHNLAKYPAIGERIKWIKLSKASMYDHLEGWEEKQNGS